MSTLSQIVGTVLLAIGAWLLWSPWALVAGGGLLLLVPEVGTSVRRRRERP